MPRLREFIAYGIDFLTCNRSRMREAWISGFDAAKSPRPAERQAAELAAYDQRLRQFWGNVLHDFPNLYVDWRDHQQNLIELNRHSEIWDEAGNMSWCTWTAKEQAFYDGMPHLLKEITEEGWAIGYFDLTRRPPSSPAALAAYERHQAEFWKGAEQHDIYDEWRAQQQTLITMLKKTEMRGEAGNLWYRGFTPAEQALYDKMPSGVKMIVLEAWRAGAFDDGNRPEFKPGVAETEIRLELAG
jgi:hypothetical protein